MIRLIGLCGYAGSGKDTAAAVLVDEHGWERRAFADKLRWVAEEANPLVETRDGRILRLYELVTREGWDQAKQHPDVRRYLQSLGAAVRGSLGERVWIDACLRHLTGPTVVTDVRYRNEAAAIEDRGGILVRVTRPGTGPVNGHSSEHDLDGYPVDHELVNDGTVDDMRRRLVRIAWPVQR